MNRIYTIAFRSIISFLIAATCLAGATLAQAALETAPPLPAGMTGSDAKAIRGQNCRRVFMTPARPR